MKISKAITCACIFFMILTAGTPWVWLNDPSPVVSIGLAEAIQSVRWLAETAEVPDLFAIALCRTLSNLQIVAGINKLFKKAKDTDSFIFSSVTDPACPLLTSNLSASFAESPLPLSIANHKPSISYRPELPPPKPQFPIRNRLKS